MYMPKLIVGFNCDISIIYAIINMDDQHSNGLIHKHRNVVCLWMVYLYFDESKNKIQHKQNTYCRCYI